ncbi:MAG: CopG family transcriptional regulator [Acidobacteriota bacterium]
MAKTIPVSIDLSDREHGLAIREAQALGISIEEVMLRSVRQNLAVMKKKPWMRFVGMVASVKPNCIDLIDETVYGSELQKGS